MYGAAELSSDLKKNVIIAISKKAGADRFENYRSIRSHVCRIPTRIIYIRMEKMEEANLSEDKFGFSRNVGTHNEIHYDLT